MMFVVRRLQEVGRKVGVSLPMCFIDLQKAYDTVDRTLLWRVLTRIGQSKPFCMNAVREPSARNTTPNFVPYTTGS